MRGITAAGVQMRGITAAGVQMRRNKQVVPAQETVDEWAEIRNSS